MKIRIYIFLINLVFLTFGCKEEQKKHQKKIVTLEKTVKKNIEKDTTSIPKVLISSLPIGEKKLLLNSVNKKITKTIFQYYDTIDGKPSPFFKPINIKKYQTFYKPTKADTINRLDVFILKSQKEHPFFKLVKILPAKEGYIPMIFEGQSLKQDYDGNEFLVNRKDLIIINNKNKIVDEMNIYYDYNDGINAKTKLFFIDKDYKIYVRYYSENEEGLSKFSDIVTFEISDNGRINKEKE